MNNNKHELVGCYFMVFEPDNSMEITGEVLAQVDHMGLFLVGIYKGFPREFQYSRIVDIDELKKHCYFTGKNCHQHEAIHAKTIASTRKLDPFNQVGKSS